MFILLKLVFKILSYVNSFLIYNIFNVVQNYSMITKNIMNNLNYQKLLLKNYLGHNHYN